MIRNILWACAVLMFAVHFSFADSERLHERIGHLERELRDMKAGIKSDSPPETVPPAVRSNHRINIYGSIKFDSSYDSSETQNGNFVMWVRRGDEYGDSEFNITANDTRLGINITPSDGGAMESRGVIEIDFCGSGGENTAQPRMRHAYFEMDWPGSGLNIKAGQTWDLISPLNPRTLNTSPLWWAGNVGFRRPQVRITQAFGGSEENGMTLSGALLRTIGRTGNTFRDPERESGAAAGHPSAQARAGFKMALLAAGKTAFGISSHWGREKYDTDDDSRKRFRSWSLHLDLLQPITEWMTLRCEVFTGENLSTYLGGIGQGVNKVHESEIRSSGGWAAFALTPLKKWTFHLGAGIDDPRRSDLNRGDRKMNSAFFVNGIYAIRDNISAGLELSHWQTKYRGEGDEENFRAQSSLTYHF